MPCCGQKRAALARSADTGAPPSNAAGAPTSAFGWVRVSYRRNAALSIAGAVTGRPYEFSAEQPILHVDARDASALVESGGFTRLP